MNEPIVPVQIVPLPCPSLPALLSYDAIILPTYMCPGPQPILVTKLALLITRTRINLQPPAPKPPSKYKLASRGRNTCPIARAHTPDICDLVDCIVAITPDTQWPDQHQHHQSPCRLKDHRNTRHALARPQVGHCHHCQSAARRPAASHAPHNGQLPFSDAGPKRKC
jgi:hypothetical protein